MSDVTKDTTPSTTPTQGEGESTPTPTSKVGKWDALALAVALKLLATPQGKDGVTAKMVVDYINTIKGNDPLAKLLPQGSKGGSFTTRQADNTLWRGCPQVKGDRQAGGGYHQPPVLLRSLTGQRPVTFTKWSKQEQAKRFGTKS